MSKKLVLVVDDEPEVTFGLRAYFLEKGYGMLTALDGIEAMRQLTHQKIDLIILDMKMPGVNGIEVLRFVHAQSPLTKVVVVTAYDVQFQDMVERLGVDGFLTKPFGIQALTTTLEQVLTGQKTNSHPATSERVESSGGPMPRARLLFVEPSEYTYKIKEIFFTDPEKCAAIYEVMAAYSLEETLSLLGTFHPDILLVELSMLGPAGDLALKVMASAHRPKELIIHGSGTGLPPAQNEKVEDLTKKGVKVVYNESFTRAGLIRLAEGVRKAAISGGLVDASH